jgi:trimeric autotransporter adhesin
MFPALPIDARPDYGQPARCCCKTSPCGHSHQDTDFHFPHLTNVRCGARRGSAKVRLQNHSRFSEAEAKMCRSDVRSRRFVRLLAAGVAGLLLSILASSAHAQFVCGGSATGAAPVTGAGATATGTASTACGAQSNALTEGTAIGSLAIAQPNTTSGANTGAVAVGNSANSFGSGATALGAASSASADYAIGIGASSVASGVGAIAVGAANSIGSAANATANQSIAIGSGTNVNANGSIAIGGNSQAGIANGQIAATAVGFQAQANALAGTAMGSNSIANGTNATALGAGSTATFSNSAAIGSGAATTRVNQVAVGTSTNTYTLAGVSSAASLAAQTGPVKVVTADAQGNLATASFSPQDISGLQSNVSVLQQQMRQAFEGTAIAIALGGASLPSDKRFAISTNWGNFRGQNAVGVAAQMRLTDYAVANLGIGGGFAQGGIGSRAGVTFAW